MRPGKYGYRMADNGKGLVPEPAEQHTLALVREFRMQGKTYKQIALELKRRDILTRTGRRWTERNLISVLNNSWVNISWQLPACPSVSVSTVCPSS